MFRKAPELTVKKFTSARTWIDEIRNVGSYCEIMSELEMLFVPFEKLFVTGCVTEIWQTKIDLFSKQNQV